MKPQRRPINDEPKAGLPVSKDKAQANFAHELANLLDGSLRNVAMVMASLRDVQNSADPTKNTSPDLVARLETANTAMRQMAQMIHNMLQTSTLLAGGDSASQAAADTFTLSTAADHLIQLLKPIADEDDITLELDLRAKAGDLPVGPLFPVMVNAVRNSMQALAQSPSKENRLVRVIARIQKIGSQQQLHLSVEDNGPGLQPQTLDDQGRFRFGVTTRAQGHGLGLPLARDIVETLGGRLLLTSVNKPGSDPSQGTILSVHIPLQRLLFETAS